jgi:hypothetical protein
MAYAFWVCQWVFRTLSCIFWMRFYFKSGAYWWFFFLWKTHKLLWAFCLHVSLIDLLFSLKQYFFYFLHVFFGRFQQNSYVDMWGHYGSNVMGVYLGPIQGPLAEHQAQLLISFGGIGLLFMKNCAPIYFSRELGFNDFIFVPQVLHFR